MQSKDTPKRVPVQVWMSLTQRTQLRQKAKDQGTTMTDYLLTLAGVQEQRVAPPIKVRPRHWWPKPLILESPEKQMEAWLKRMEAARGRQIGVEEWTAILRLYLGLRLQELLKKTWWPKKKKWLKGNYRPKDQEEARTLQVFAEFEKLNKLQRNIWSVSTGHKAAQRKKHRAENLVEMRAKDRERQRKRSKKLREARDAQRQAFVDEHVTEHVAPNDAKQVANDDGTAVAAE